MNVTTAAPPARRSLTEAQFRTEAISRFGPDIAAWAFECPGCGTVSCARDFPETCTDRAALAAVECIGRHVEGRGCRRIAYGLVPGPWMVKLADDSVVASFPFADALSEPLRAARGIGGTGGPARAETPSAPLAAPESAPSAPEPPRPYWTAEEGWTDAHGIGCTCGADGRSELCGRCEQLLRCPLCAHEVLVPRDDMAAHLVEVHEGDLEGAPESEA